mmetsp:Transcript_102504/g.319393  ORF Transcript_102504/g.319393 Transcript_102504/m.319393 type:complete len:218 (-) Transcript_102504:610-1263(-)
MERVPAPWCADPARGRGPLAELLQSRAGEECTCASSPCCFWPCRGPWRPTSRALWATEGRSAARPRAGSCSPSSCSRSCLPAVHSGTARSMGCARPDGGPPRPPPWCCRARRRLPRSLRRRQRRRVPRPRSRRSSGVQQGHATCAWRPPAGGERRHSRTLHRRLAVDCRRTAKPWSSSLFGRRPSPPSWRARRLRRRLSTTRPLRTVRTMAGVRARS